MPDTHFLARLCLLFLTLAVSTVAFAQQPPVIDSGGIFNASGGIGNPRPSISHLAPNVIFVIYGKDLGPQVLVSTTPPNYGPSLAGTSISFTSREDGATISALMYYTSATQIAGLLPSSTEEGVYDVRVTYNGRTSDPQVVKVLEHSFGIATANGQGTGVTQATIREVNGGLSLTRFTSFGRTGDFVHSPAHPGDTISLYGTGGGADLANDTGGTLGDQSDEPNFEVQIGNRTIKPLYTGAVAGFPGLWLLNFTLPKDITPDCFAWLSVTVYDYHERSNFVVLPIAPVGQSACSDPVLTPEQLVRFDSEGSLVGAAFTIAKTVTTVTSSLKGQATTSTTSAESASGSFARYSAAAYSARRPSGYRIDACEAYLLERPLDDVLEPASTAPFSYLDTNPSSYLNAGPAISLSGPGANAANSALVRSPTDPTTYSLALPAGSVSSGAYTLAGQGGPEVKPFSADLTVPAAFTVNNWDSFDTLVRYQPLTLTWTGGGSGLVRATLQGSSVAYDSDFGNLPYRSTATIVCEVPAARGTLTIPARLVQYLPWVSRDDATDSTSSLWVRAEPYSADTGFGADLLPEGKAVYATFGYSIGVARNPAIQ